MLDLLYVLQNERGEREMTCLFTSPALRCGASSLRLEHSHKTCFLRRKYDTGSKSHEGPSRLISGRRLGDVSRLQISVSSGQEVTLWCRHKLTWPGSDSNHDPQPPAGPCWTPPGWKPGVSQTLCPSAELHIRPITACRP